jgi:hypothetical protein
MGQRKPHEIEEDAADAQHILTDPGFRRLTDSIRAEWQELVFSGDLGELTVQRAHANIRGLDALLERLQSRVNDLAVAVKRGSFK